MLNPIEQLKDQINKLDQQLMYHLILQQMETNRLLAQLISPKQEAEVVKIDDLNRQELMKCIAKLPNNPKGWNKWHTEDMRKHLKEAS